jgi:hypothetical protein
VKKTAIFIFCIVAATTSRVYAQDTFSIGLGLEANGYSSNKLVGAGPVFGMDYRINEMWAIGMRELWAIDLGAQPIMDITTVQIDFTVRWYFLRWKSLVEYYFLWQEKYHFFIQVEGGGMVAMNYAPVKGMAGIEYLSLGGTLGCRIVTGTSGSFYWEPYIRFGNLSQAGAGVIFGYTFHSNRGGY